MTLSSTVAKVSHNGNGASTAFGFAYYFFADADLSVVLVDADGTEHGQTLNTHYTVSGAGNPSGGTVTMSAAPASGKKLVIKRKPAFVQSIDYATNDPFPAQSHEDALDRRAMAEQSLQEELDRAIKAPIGDLAPALVLPGAAARADRLLGFDAGGNVAALNAADIVITEASESIAGKVELATDAETVTGTDAARATHPRGVKAAIDAAIAALRNGVSSTLDTLQEIALALAARLTAANNLSDLAHTATARSNLGLGALATKSSVGPAEIDTDAVSNAKLANMATATIKGRATVGTGDPEDLTPAQARGVMAVREILTAARTYYVRTDGSDANNGLSNTSGGAFLTVQQAIDVAATLDFGIYDVTIQIADGTYTAGMIAKNLTGSGALIVQGNAGTPSNVLFDLTGECFRGMNFAGTYRLKDFKLQSSGGLGFIAALGYLEFGNIDFGNVASYHMFADTHCLLKRISTYTVSGNAVVHGVATAGGKLDISNGTIVYNNNPTFVYNIYCFQQGSVAIQNVTFTNGGTVTGQRYLIPSIGVIFTSGAGANYIPGNVAGVDSTGLGYV